MAGEAVLSSFMQVLFEKLSMFAWNEFRSLRGVREEVENLSSTLSTIQAVLEDAEEKQLKDRSVRSWLAKLKDAAYDVDDLLDNYAAENLRLKLEGDRAQSSWKKQVCDCLSCSLWHKGLFECKIARRIRAVRGKLDKIAKERDVLGLQALGGMRVPEIMERPQTSSLVDCMNVFGREEDRDNIVDLLLSSNESSPANVSVLPIVGMGGLGKTTLTQLVYNDSRVREYFQLRMWVSVSENFDEKKLTKETLESARSGFSSVNTTMNMLQEKLYKKLKGKRFLLVLDDVWNEDHNKWHSYRSALIAGRRGSKIVVTTQNENVGRIMGGMPPYRLQRLSDSDCWLLFKNCAFVDGNSNLHPTLEIIGKEIVKKIKGLPLAAKALGSLLYSKVDEEEWKSILKSEIWELAPDKNTVLPALRLSYKHLPPHLKQCFAFCSVFHKDHVFERDRLVLIWIALGFVRPQGRKRLEDIGNGYFDDLLSRSFFQCYKGKYVMHDAIHDLAQSMSVDECHRLEDGKGTSARGRIRHLSFSCDDTMFTSFELFYGFRRLRTLMLLRGYKSMTAPVPDGLFFKLRCLRVLDLHRRDITQLPDSIGNLKQLRYLGLPGSEIKTLPSSICKLYNLQALVLKDCNSLRELPEGVTNLINLRHLQAHTRLLSDITGIGKLTHLQELEEFVVRKERGCRIAELKNMTELRGNLCIRSLENVASGEEASEARLNTKEYLNVLEFTWEDNRDACCHEEYLDEKVLEGLRPHCELKELTIKNFAGSVFPNWLGSPSFSSLHQVHLSNCRRCELLPPLGQLPFLRYLDIAGNGTVRIGQEFIGNGETRRFPSLNALLLEDMPRLEEWTCAEDDQLFPCLTELDIIDCPKLKALPRLPPSLTRIRISEAGIGALPELWGSNQPSSLSSLYIECCPNLTSLQQGLLGHQLMALRELTITNCERLVSLAERHFQPLVSLKSLRLYGCPRLMPWTVQEALLPSSLEDIRVGSCYNLINMLLGELKNLSFLGHFEIADCPDLYHFPSTGLPPMFKFLAILDCFNLQALPQGLKELTSLTTLVICNCPQIMCLPEEGLPDGLQELYIKACPSLRKRCSLGGKDWVKVAHVAKVEIEEEEIMCL
ncbi:putative disease resistance protein RGA3 [Elaeis guineensis]|uniref:Disease resistance protein RGA3 n=1 Tax=Elaeis guineensis var. tenera TaxID=51953 RepID=A0A6I9RS75_ELAGV|nr:putative disease resistance protein RGA3 [Elaeis guineensis]